MTGQEDQSKKSKKFAVGDLPPSPTTSTGMIGNAKRPTRHHVKRRSSGRVHVSKLAPMARAHAEADSEKPIKRSQSNKSLSRLSTLERSKSTSMISLTPALDDTAPDPHSPPTTPPMKGKETDTIKPTFHVSNTMPAAPVEHTLPVTADDLVTDKKKTFLKSQFVDKKTTLSNAASSGMTRTQQKLLLQREQSLIHDENHIAHPKNMIRLTREMEKMGKEYRCVRKYQDPMMDSLIRCHEKQQQQKMPHKLHQRTHSSTQLSAPVPHMEQRRQILLKTALQKQQQEQEQHDESSLSLLDGNRWSAGNLLERLFYGVS
ncbi:hypothetical protein A0J61_03862 [Choanephora cucurbitarum]|uniref:Uncharacterized protein n=1 Tax=Choanephora cucurbitarum TaxID=101091 RepID=A0A1C7NG79_9FUNG|nr:hypothetical protein A0J61_03862 [Choanephora cucurbitarum]